MHLSSNVKNLFFIRHGQTDFNKTKRFMGSLDIPLNKHGISQILETLPLLQQQPISAIYTSPLTRALQTASIISYFLELPLFVVADLQERNFGLMEGKRKPHYQKRFFPKGEAINIFENRTIKGLKKIKHDKALIVAHSGTFQILQNKFYQIKTPYTSIKNAQLAQFTIISQH
jgi:broad specificity phosphatase PhoE